MFALAPPLLALNQPACPERDDPAPEGWLEDRGQRALGALQRRARRWWVQRTDIAARVHRDHADAARLEPQELRDAARVLGQRLRREGLRSAHVAHAFALASRAAELTLAMRPYDVQLQGAWVMLQGMVAEMQTGEGKTLTASLTACVAALAGVPVHVVTVNDYLVERDAELLRPLYAALGLSVGTATEQQTPQQRRAAYACHITYVTNKTLVFDYLRDRIALRGRGSGLRLQLERLAGAGQGALLLRGLSFAIVDEADSVLVDEARTPLIISAPQDDTDEARVVHQGLAIARQLRRGEHYLHHAAERRIELTRTGRQRLQALCTPLGGVWAGFLRREELATQALSAEHLFERDVHYIVIEGKVQIVDEHTGRVMADRSWERGLHQLIEAKEGCAITAQKTPLARISYQRFFRRYLRLCGMTGTAREVAGELGAVYGLACVTIPTHRPSRRRELPRQVLATDGAKWRAVGERVAAEHARGRPVLLGTRSVAASERASVLLQSLGLAHRVLNAKQDREEAEIVAQAGSWGQITIATNMAGRGTDIKIGAEVAALGGLHVVLSELHDARRIDRQLVGRCARQGDPGSFEAILCTEDSVMTSLDRLWRRISAALLRRAAAAWPAAAPWLGSACLRLAQRGIERRHAHVRKGLLKVDHETGRLLAFSGRPE